MTEERSYTPPGAASNQREGFGAVLRNVLDTIPHNRRTALTGTTSEQYITGEKIPSPFAINTMSNRLGLDARDPRRTILNNAAVDARIKRGK